MSKFYYYVSDLNKMFSSNLLSKTVLSINRLKLNKKQTEFISIYIIYAAHGVI